MPLSLGRVTLLLLAGRVLRFALALANSILIARALGVEHLGAYAYAMGIAGFFGLLPHMGIGTLLSREIARDPERGRRAFPTALRAQALMAVATFTAIPTFAALLPGQPVALFAVGLAAAQLALGTLSWPYLAVLSGLGKYDWLALVEIVSGAAGTLCLLAAVLLGADVATILSAQVAASLVAVVVARRIARRFFSGAGGRAEPILAFLRQAAPFGANAILHSVYTRLDVVLLGQLSTIFALGLYSVAYKPTNLAVYLGLTVAGPLFPLMAQWSGKGSPPDAFSRALRWMGACGPAMALFFSGCAAPLLVALYGEEYRAAAPILTLLGWSAAAHWIHAALGTALQATGRERWWLGALSGAFVLNALGNLWAIPRWGATGAALATLASELVLLGLGAVLAARLLGLHPPIGIVAAVVLAGTSGGAVLWVFATTHPAAATLGALLLYAGVLRLLGIIGREDWTRVVSWTRQIVPRAQTP